MFEFLPVQLKKDVSLGFPDSPSSKGLRCLVIKGYLKEVNEILSKNDDNSNKMYI